MGAYATAHPPLASSGPYLPSLSLAPSARHHLRQEPDAGNPPVRICAGGTEKSVSLPRQPYSRCVAARGLVRRTHSVIYGGGAMEHKTRRCRGRQLCNSLLHDGRTYEHGCTPVEWASEDAPALFRSIAYGRVDGLQAILLGAPNRVIELLWWP